MKFKWRLFFSYLLVFLIPFFLAEQYLTDYLKNFLIKQTESHLRKEALLIKTIIEKDYKLQNRSYEIDSIIKKMGRYINERITFIDRDGRVLGDSEIPEERLRSVENHSTRPEFIEAFRSTYGSSIRYSNTLKINMMYVGVKVAPKGNFIGVVRVSLPLTQIKDLIQRTEKGLIMAFVGCTGLILILSIIASKRLSLPVEEVTRTAEEISRGNFDVKVYPSSGGEIEVLAGSINRMASSIKKNLNEITREKEMLQAILTGMSEGVMVVNTKGEIVLINQVISDLFRDWPMIIGKKPVEIIRNARLQEGFTYVLTTGGSFREEFSFSISNKKKVFDVTIVGLSRDGKHEGALAVFHDITDIKRTEKIQKDFIANVSHELRTPLTSIKGYAETLCSEGIKDISKIRQFAGVILKHANLLSNIVDDLLSLASLELEVSVPSRKEINLVEIVDSSVTLIRKSADSKGISIRIESSTEKVMVWADKKQIGQAIVNLLDNAVKYTPEGGTITVIVKDYEKEAHITVKDTGIGIPEEELDRIFERFYRVDKNRSREVGGTGLGLSIVKQVIIGHGGNVWVRSRLGKGSEFNLNIPKRMR